MWSVFRPTRYISSTGLLSPQVVSNIDNFQVQDVVSVGGDKQHVWRALLDNLDLRGTAEAIDMTEPDLPPQHTVEIV